MSTSPASAVPPILTPGEWESLLYVSPDRVRHLVMKLAVYHGAIEPPTPVQFPLCGKQRDEPQQLTFDAL
jgi:hypothetical protein